MPYSPTNTLIVFARQHYVSPNVMLVNVWTVQPQLIQLYKNKLAFSGMIYKFNFVKEKYTNRWIKILLADNVTKLEYRYSLSNYLKLILINYIPVLGSCLLITLWNYKIYNIRYSFITLIAMLNKLRSLRSLFNVFAEVISYHLYICIFKNGYWMLLWMCLSR
jgi:hypothetical protein